MAAAGQIIKRTERTWMVRIFLGRDPITNKRKYHNHTVHGNKKDAQAYLTGALRERDLGRFQEPTRMALSEYLHRWLEEAAQHKVRERTFHEYSDIVRRYIVEPIGHYKLAQLTPLAIQNFHTKMRERGLGTPTIKKVHVVLSASLDQAVRWGMLAYNPAKSVEKPRMNGTQHHQTMLVFSPEEAKLFLQVARANRWGVLFSLALQTGTRPSEYLALQWQDIDWQAQVIRIRRSLYRRRHGKGWKFEEPKTKGSTRVINVAPELLAELRKHSETQEYEKAAFRQTYEDHGLVFAGTGGRPLDSNNLLKRYLRPILAEAGLNEKITLYSLRHSSATLLLSAGIHPKIVAERLGHSSCQLTLDVYSHVIPTMQQASVDRLSSLLQ